MRPVRSSALVRVVFTARCPLGASALLPRPSQGGPSSRPQRRPSDCSEGHGACTRRSHWPLVHSSPGGRSHEDRPGRLVCPRATHCCAQSENILVGIGCGGRKDRGHWDVMGQRQGGTVITRKTGTWVTCNRAHPDAPGPGKPMRQRRKGTGSSAGSPALHAGAHARSGGQVSGR